MRRLKRKKGILEVIDGPRDWINPPPPPRVRNPKVPKLMKNANLVVSGLVLELYSSSGSNMLNNHKNLIENVDRENGKPAIGAGRGGKHYGKTSAMGQIAETKIKPGKQMKKEHIPYRPKAQMHELKSLEDIQRACGIRRPINSGRGTNEQ